MIPRDDDFDIFVSRDVLVEVWRDDHVSQAQQFGEDWDGPLHTAMHEAVFVRRTVHPVMTWRQRACFALDSHCGWIVCAAVAVLVLLYELGLWQ